MDQNDDAAYGLCRAYKLKAYIEKNSTEMCSILNIIAILALVIALWIVSMYPGRGDYEINIFSAYPIPVWLLLGVTIVCGFISAFLAIRYRKQTYGWVVGLLLVVTTNALIIALPYLRDYAFISHGDSMAHFRKALAIIEKGRVGRGNFYPLTHLMAAAFAMFSGLKLEVVTVSLPVVFYLVYIANTLFLGLSLGGVFAALGTMALMAAPLVFDTFITELKPTTLGVFMLPLFFAWLYRAYFGNPRWTDRLVFFSILISLAIIHPWAVIAALVMLFLTIIAALYSKAETNRPRNLPWLAILLLGGLWLAWFIRFKSFNTVINVLLDFQKATDSQVGERISSAGQVSIPIQKVIELLILNYGVILLYYIPAAVVMLWVLAQILKRKRQIPVIQLVLALFVSFFSLLSVASIFVHLFTNQATRTVNHRHRASTRIGDNLDIRPGTQEFVIGLLGAQIASSHFDHLRIFWRPCVIPHTHYWVDKSRVLLCRPGRSSPSG